jgi:hypothetical protein
MQASAMSSTKWNSRRGLPLPQTTTFFLAAPFDAAADLGECQFDEFTHRTGLAGSQHEIVGLICLQ